MSQLKKLPKFLLRRREIVGRYNETFSQLEGIRLLKDDSNLKSSYHLYPVRLDFSKIKISKSVIFAEFKKLGIFVNVHYIPVYLQPFYKKIGYKKGLCPNAEKYYEEALTLPLYPKMSDTDVGRVIKATKEIIRKYVND